MTTTMFLKSCEDQLKKFVFILTEAPFRPLSYDDDDDDELRVTYERRDQKGPICERDDAVDDQLTCVSEIL